MRKHPHKLKGVELLKWFHAAAMADQMILPHRYDTRALDFSAFRVRICRWCGAEYQLNTRRRNMGATPHYCRKACHDLGNLKEGGRLDGERKKYTRRMPQNARKGGGFGGKTEGGRRK
jgi:hypothetical protein